MKTPYASNAMILEGVLTTLGPLDASTSDSSTASEQTLLSTWTAAVNVAPMGPIVDESMKKFIFRPFKTSTTYFNLKDSGQGVFHLTDNTLLIARAAMRKVLSHKDLNLRTASVIKGLVIGSACRYYEIKVTELDDREDRTKITAQVVHTESIRDFLGFNRARHAVIEAAILATRLHLTGPQHVLEQFSLLQTMIDKTGTDVEQQALDELTDYVKKNAPNQEEESKI